MAETLVNSIRRWESKITALLDRLEDTTQGEPDERRALRAELRERLDILARVEDDHLLPVLEYQSSDAPERADQLRADRVRAFDRLTALEAVDPEQSEFQTRIEAASSEIRVLLDQEMSGVLPAIDRAVLEPQRTELARAIEAKLNALESERIRTAGRQT